MDIFTFENRTDDEGLILTAVSGEPVHASVPSFYNGKAVTAIGKYAFSGQKSLQSIELPETVCYIGTHAFYNCRSLTSATIKGALRAVEDGAFKNCKKLHHIYMENMQHLDLLLNNISTEVTLHICLDEDTKLTLLFPEYDFTYQEFVQPRLYDLIPFGSGSYFRMSAGVHAINFAEYDKAFVYSELNDLPVTSLTLALYRLMSPYKLTDEAKGKYLTFIKAHMQEAQSLVLDWPDCSMLEVLLGSHLCKEENLSEMIRLASAADKAEAVSLLMEHKMTAFAGSKKRFSL